MALDPTTDPTQQNQQLPEQAQPAAPQPKNMFNASKAFFNQLNNGVQQKSPNLAAVGKRKIDTVGNMNQTVNDNTDKVKERTQAISKLAGGFDFSKGFNAPDASSDIAKAGTDENQGVSGTSNNKSKPVDPAIPAPDTSGLDSAVKVAVSNSGGTQNIGGKSIAVKGNAEQIQAAGQVATDQFVQTLKGYYGGQQDALTKFSDDANRFLDSSTADMAKRNLGTVAEASASELQDQSAAQMFADPSLAGSNAGALKTLSAWSGGALDSNIYGSDIQGLRNQATDALAGQQAAKSQAGQQNKEFLDTTAGAKKSLADYTDKTSKDLTKQATDKQAEAEAKGKSSTDAAVQKKKDEDATTALKKQASDAAAAKEAADRAAWKANPNTDANGPSTGTSYQGDRKPEGTPVEANKTTLDVNQDIDNKMNDSMRVALKGGSEDYFYNNMKEGMSTFPDYYKQQNDTAIAAIQNKIASLPKFASQQTKYDLQRELAMRSKAKQFYK